MADLERARQVPTGYWNFEKWQAFFGCEDFSMEDIDILVEAALKKPENEWMLEQPKDLRRVYVMSVEYAKSSMPAVGTLRSVS